MAILKNPTPARNFLGKTPGANVISLLSTAPSLEFCRLFMGKYEKNEFPEVTDAKILQLICINEKTKQPEIKFVVSLEKSHQPMINDPLLDSSHSLQESEYAQAFTMLAKREVSLTGDGNLTIVSDPKLILPARGFNPDFFNAGIFDMNMDKPPLSRTGAYGRPRPWAGKGKTHSGVDWALTKGDLVFAARDGEVRHAHFDADAGYYINVNHDSVVTVYTDAGPIQGILHTRYLHAGENLAAEGQEVTVDTPLQKTGNSGNAKNLRPMFHFEVRLPKDMGVGMLDAPRVNPYILLQEGTVRSSVDWTNVLVTFNLV
ncbi:Peptidase family M23 [Candidatus Gugararchaeum adminiculabundum]|nr:Peptidase family M23 [Candidatus Gugararchaeum adminiculabundum]